jgi:hypothetical protein
VGEGKALHYAGALYWKKDRKAVTILAGWAACSTGKRALAIRDEGRHTYEAKDVTRKACLANMKRSDDYSASQRRE